MRQVLQASRDALNLAKGAYAFVRVTMDLKQTDAVFKVAAKLRTPERMTPLLAHFGKDPEGARALEEWPRLGEVDLAALKKLPEGSLGRSYAEHMDRLGLDPNFFPPEKVENAIDFISMHIYETHDIWHVVTGYDTSEAGELGLQAFYLAQFPQGPVPPVLLAAGLLNGVFFNRADVRARMDKLAAGWRRGNAARPLFGMRWAELWETPLASLRETLRLTDSSL